MALKHMELYLGNITQYFMIILIGIVYFYIETSVLSALQLPWEEIRLFRRQLKCIQKISQQLYKFANIYTSLYLHNMKINTFIYPLEAVCPSGWMRHDNSCYHFSHDKEDWPNAVVNPVFSLHP